MPQRFLAIKNFEKYQTQDSKRTYPWIKLYRSLLTDAAFIKLDIMSRYIYVGLLILASETNNHIPNDVSYLSHRLSLGFQYGSSKVSGRSTSVPLSFHDGSTSVPLLDLKPLYRSGLLQASKTTKWRLEKSRERVELEKNPPTPQGGVVLVADDFEQFWKVYPKKVGKGDARKAWIKAKDRPSLNTILQSVETAKRSVQWVKDAGQFIPNPSTWLNQERWMDEHAQRQPSTFESFLNRGGPNGSSRISPGLDTPHHATMGESLPQLTTADADERTRSC